MDRGEQLAVLGGFAADQWGLVTAAQAKDAGLNGVQLLRLTEAGLLESAGRGVYLLTAAGQPQHLEIKVAWLRLQPKIPAWQRQPGDPDSGVISHASACQLHDLGDIPAPRVEISVPRRRTTNDSFVHLRTVVLDPAEITLADGLPVTTAPRTIVDLLHAKADGGHIGAVIAEAERRDLISLPDLAERVGPFARKYGLPRTADGQDLIDHLVAQSGEHLRSQEVARASREGFNAALQLLAARDLGHQSRVTRDLLGQSSAAEAINKAMGDALPPSFALSGFRDALESMRQQGLLGQSSAAEAINKAMRDALPPSFASSAMRDVLQSLRQHGLMTTPQQEIARVLGKSLRYPDYITPALKQLTTPPNLGLLTPAVLRAVEATRALEAASEDDSPAEGDRESGQNADSGDVEP
ncbi:type IV toxin-antitoxin system AbiEi family antitoxin domain-containing protein [Actinacidiphila glaucinigra]|uniref:type IV toxin-antitoxin system AbiEi family antitoxin domain-containing protein n=1 Tax=Actinacidiphila glaucinigra TaxID=235986 RepID=UPI0035D8BC9D